MFLQNVQKGDDIRTALTADNINTVFNVINRLEKVTVNNFHGTTSPCHIAAMALSRLAKGTPCVVNKGCIDQHKQDYFLHVQTFQNTDNTIIGIAADNIEAQTIGKVIVSGIALGYVTVTDISMAFAAYADNKLVSTNDESAPVRLVFAPNTGTNVLCVLLLGYGTGNSLKGPFDVILVQSQNDGEEPRVLLRCYDSSAPLSAVAGFISAGLEATSMPTQEWEASEGKILYVEVNYDSATDKLTFAYGFELEMPTINDDDRRYVVRIASVSKADGRYTLHRHRAPGDIEVTGRWIR